MENLKLLSVRLDPDALRQIEQLTVHHPYWKRNAIINHLLSTLMKCAGDDTIWNMLSVIGAFEKGYVMRFEPDPDTLRQRAGQNLSKKY